MTPAEFIHENTLGGPGLDGYAYRAEVYCVECGEDLTREVAEDVAPTLTGTDDWLFSDSETVPTPVFFGECDHGAEHCARCGEYLYGEDGDENGNEDGDGAREGGAG